MKTYSDRGQVYLELHARRAPLGPYAGRYAEAADPRGVAYEGAVDAAIEDFEAAYDVEVVRLGRSGRHICVEDTARNRRRYARLARAANEAADVMWAAMRAPTGEAAEA